jgi:hypothetical protein
VCSHNNETTYIELLSFDDQHEIYQCDECGCLINLRAKENFTGPLWPMSAQEITDSIKDLIANSFDQLSEIFLETIGKEKRQL